MERLKHSSCLIFCLGLLFPSLASPSNIKDKLHNIIDEIQSIKKTIGQSQNQQTKLQHDLKKTEIEISQINVQLNNTTQSIEKQQDILKKLTANQLKYSSLLTKEYAMLSKQLRIAYRFRHKETIKILLNQQKPSDIDRLLKYHRYFSHHSMKQISDLKTTLHDVEKNKNLIAHTTKNLITLSNQQKKSSLALLQHKKDREQLLLRLNSTLQQSNQKLQELLNNKRQLESTIEKLRRKRSKVNASLYVNQHKGHLPWPTKGAITEHFGTPIAHSQLKQNGVIISAPEGQSVYAVAPGQVVFANWMAGYGLLLIIDHGKGYMTLYGNNSTLYKKEKELIHEGDMIASVGHSGGQTHSALYFALRYNGKPVDPSTWCSP